MLRKAILFFIIIIVFSPFPVLAQETFTRNLYFGLYNNPEVVKAQEFLRGLGFFNYPVSNGNYLWTTVTAVKKFQQAYNIYPASGYFGAKTRVVANRVSAEKNFSASVSTEEKPATPVIQSAESPYKNKIKLTYVDGYGTRPESEVIYIENWGQEENINITGFVLQSVRGGRLAIPPASSLPGIYSGRASDAVVLKPGKRAVINVGKNPGSYGDFQTNLCTGYFNESARYSPVLSNRCPRPDTKKLPLDISDRCVNIIDSTPACRLPDYSFVFPANDNACRDFLGTYLNYQGCVAQNRARPDFYQGEWYIWMGRPEEFLRKNREVLILRDREGREVDRYSY